MESSAGAECLRDKCILITGSTGYLGKLLVEKILRVQPAVKKLYLLVRAPDATSAEQRVLSEVIGKDPFNLLREKYGITGFQNFIKEKVVPLAGDIMDGYLGLDNSSVHALSEEIDVIINVAETTNFDERIFDALVAAYNEQALPCFIRNPDDIIDVEMDCPNSLDTRSLCANDGFGNNCFYLTLTEDFKFMTCVPCFARAELLKKLNVARDEETTITAFLNIKEGFYFKVMIQNEKDQTFFGFHCLNWRDFAKAYKLEVGTELSPDIGQQTNCDIWVDLDKLPMIPPCYLRVPKETQRMVDNIYYTAGTIVTLEEMKEVIRFLDSMNEGVRHYRAGKSFGPYMPLAHTLSMTNIEKKYLEIPTPCVPQQMPANGDMRIIVHDKTNFTCTYSTSADDGCILVNGWKQLLETYHVEIGDRLIAVLHYGPRGPFLFLTSIFEGVLECH
ncbi:uncharacterized protein LOC119298835 isoform X1 [Triticum dicoccoides]|uniref:uncharacterized protein LOC119298835 isoform X1 n=1 Tax=Triticum dicoccoides TaxID=85692 RepID=UPI00188F6AA0|nr:uncharacterized protein LOC119298835 isoform X1 [Triticum dicoccoides]